MIPTVSEKVSFEKMLSGLGDLIHADRGETIYHPGTLSTSVHLVESGRVKLAYLDESGKKLTQFAREHGFHPQRLGRWKSRLELASTTDQEPTKMEAPAARFVEVAVKNPPQRLGPVDILCPSGHVIRVQDGFAPNALLDVLDIMEAGRC